MRTKYNTPSYSKLYPCRSRFKYKKYHGHENTNININEANILSSKEVFSLIPKEYREFKDVFNRR